MRRCAFLFLIALASPALAAPNCTMESRGKWLSEAEMRTKVAAQGDTIEVFKITKGNCYEIYGRNPKGKRIEIYFNPVTGETVRSS